MHRLKDIRTSLEVGFAEGALPESFAGLRGREWRAVPCTPELPFEDAQFDVVMLDGGSVTRATVKEVHRVLRPEGCLRFAVPERTKKQEGFTLPEVYSIVREGFNIVEVERSGRWLFSRRRRTMTICAQKKNWKSLVHTYRPYL